MEAIIIKLTANQIVVDYEGQQHSVFAPGKWKYQNIVLRPGDRVRLSYVNNAYQITDLIARKNVLDKPKVANIDNLIILQSLIDPVLNWKSLIKTFAFYEYQLGIRPILVITKTDLVTMDDSMQEHINDLKQLGYQIFNKHLQTDFDHLKELLVNKISCFVGQSGVGKSTIMNDFDPNFAREFGAVSKKLKRGKNTTTQTELLPFCNGYIIDTPGYSKFHDNLTNEQLSEAFVDYKEWKLSCKFSNCLHQSETGCHVIACVQNHHEPVWRYEFYLKMLADNNIK